MSKGPLSLRPARDRKRSAAKAPTRRLQNQAPDDGPDHVFLVRAIEAIGRSAFGESWAPPLAGSPTPPRIPSWSDDLAEHADPRLRSDVAETLRKIEPEAAAAADERLDFDDDWVLDPSLWAAAIAARDAEIAAIKTADSRANRVFSDLLAKLRQGEIKTFSRPASGGEYVLEPPSIWNFEGWKARFADGRFDRDAPYDEAENEWGDATIGQSHYLFVGRQELEREAHLEGDRPDLNRLWPELSPMMQLAIRAAEAIRKEGREPSLPEFRDNLMQLAEQYGVELKPSLAEKVGTIVRSERAGKGGRPKKS